ncbi:hypothetical protein WSM22_35740 [Cytophagales bacterium WSM2-2]|nr:hypothetical protein WSM22_35740 [Cytophagales bacterium WSM2-2]
MRKKNIDTFLIPLLFTLVCCGGSPKVRILNNRLNLGDVKRYDTLNCVFPIINDGDSPLLITKLKGSCECISIVWDSTKVLSGDTTYIKVRLVPDVVGVSTKDIVFQTNTNPPFNTLSIETNVKE